MFASCYPFGAGHQFRDERVLSELTLCFCVMTRPNFNSKHCQYGLKAAQMWLGMPTSLEVVLALCPLAWQLK